MALTICFSPVLVDLARHLTAEPWTLYVLLFPPLLARCALADRPGRSSAGIGAPLLALGLALELAAVGGGIVRLGRLGLPLAVIGMTRAFGLLSWRAALLSLWWVPLPHLLVSFPSPVLETAWLDLAAWPLHRAGTDVAVETALLRTGAGELMVSESDGGLPLAAMLSGLGWYTSARRGDGLWRCARRAASWAVWAFPLQVAVVELAAAGLVLGVAAESLQLLLRFFWIPTAAVALLLAGRRIAAGGDDS